MEDNAATQRPLVLVTLLLLLPSSGCGNGHAQRALQGKPSVVKSTEDNKASIDYKIGRRQLLLKPPQMLHIQISIAPGLFVREKMSQWLKNSMTISLTSEG